jgi:hypothetical protein
MNHTKGRKDRMGMDSSSENRKKNTKRKEDQGKTRIDRIIII